jgi:hypothetical protein
MPFSKVKSPICASEQIFGADEQVPAPGETLKSWATAQMACHTVLAATNKCLARRNKSRKVDKATKRRGRERLSGCDPASVFGRLYARN